MIEVRLLSSSEDMLEDPDFNICLNIAGSLHSLTFDHARELRNKLSDAMTKALIFQAITAKTEKDGE